MLTYKNFTFPAAALVLELQYVVALCDDSDEVLDSIIPRNFTTHHLLTD
jgi:hypothetical protein